ncbi:MAG TPA: alpha/beta hydrolase-fold protein [Planctomycetota bacterium]|nr:alpha/beta hydrolase-fold protein [Planctomycetota bacterium]
MDELRDKTSGLTYFELLPEREARGLAVVLHGRGVTKEDLVELGQVLVEDGFVALVPDAPMPWDGGRAWFDRDSRSRDIPISRGMIASLIRGAQARHGVGRDETLISGFSQGGVMSLDVALNHPDLVGRAACLSGYLSQAEAPSGKVEPAPSIFMAHGTRDPLITIDRARESRDLLVSRGFAVHYVEYPIPHAISAEELVELRRWLTA